MCSHPLLRKRHSSIRMPPSWLALKRKDLSDSICLTQRWVWSGENLSKISFLKLEMTRTFWPRLLIRLINKYSISNKGIWHPSSSSLQVSIHLYLLQLTSTMTYTPQNLLSMVPILLPSYIYKQLCFKFSVAKYFFFKKQYLP